MVTHQLLTNEMKLLDVVVFLGLLAVATPQRKSYEGYKVLDIETLDERAVKTVYPLTEIFDFWIEPRVGASARVLVSPEEFDKLHDVLHSEDIPFKIFVDDLEKSLKKNEETYSKINKKENRISFTKFNRLAEIFDYLDYLSGNYPDLVSVSSIGKSLEGRDLRLIKISTGGGSRKPAIFIDATIHAREWIATSVALYTIQQLVENSANNSHLLNSVDWYILPVINPDGYEYTHTTDRFWRKTMSYNGDPDCLGVDANRNFDFHWGELGSSADKCSLAYSGPHPFSEPETAALSAYILSSPADIQLYLTLHSYGQLMLHPWGYTEDPPSDVNDLENLANEAVDALEKVRGTKYTVGSSAEVLYYSAGTSRDWAKGQAGIKYSYTMELPAGGTGFDPPASDIIPVVTESFEAIKVFGRAIGSLRRPRS